MARVRSDFADVKQRFQALLGDSEATKQALELADKKLADMCNKQMNKLEIAYRSMIKALESKKKEFMSILGNFYSDQRQSVNYDRARAANFYQRVMASHHEELVKLE